jgi:aspartyl-tRNA(Asn)/glutamyl-tRNA(Gln) amidotransferase subunit C
MSLTTEDVKKVAVLARLEFSEAEIAVFTEQLGNIVAFVEQLSQVPTDGIEPMAHPLDGHSVLRDDELSTGLSREAALSNSPNHDETFFLVPPVMARKISV